MAIIKFPKQELPACPVCGREPLAPGIGTGSPWCIRCGYNEPNWVELLRKKRG